MEQTSLNYYPRQIEIQIFYFTHKKIDMLLTILSKLEIPDPDLNKKLNFYATYNKDYVTI